MRAVQIDVWSDYVCPFCYLAEPALEELVAEGKGTVTLRWRAFELRPEPGPTLDPKSEYLRDIWAESVYPLARQRGMTLTLPPVQPRSRLAHEATALASAHGKASELAHAIFQAFFEHGTDIGRVEELGKLAAGVGLDPAEVTMAFTSGRHRPEVLEDEELAREFGLSGVPAIVIRVVGAPWEQAVLISGAQPCDVLRAAVAQVRAQAG